jgi:hypothetical protein
LKDLVDTKRITDFGTDDALAITAWTISVAQAVVATVWMRVTWYGYRAADVPTFSLPDKIFADKVFFTQGLQSRTWPCQVVYHHILDASRG